MFSCYPSSLQNLIMSESATMMVEFEHLSRVTGDAKYHNAVSFTGSPASYHALPSS
jgi:hypothetical protein